MVSMKVMPTAQARAYAATHFCAKNCAHCSRVNGSKVWDSSTKEAIPAHEGKKRDGGEGERRCVCMRA